MSRSQQKRMPAGPAAASESLAKLYRLYGAHSVTPDAFGRRAALPSEIAHQLKRRSGSPDGSKSPNDSGVPDGRGRRSSAARPR